VKARGLIGALILLSAACGYGGGNGAGASRDHNPKNELPFGYIDFPTNGATVERDMAARGWAMDDGRIAAVRIYLDNHFIATTTLTESRPDVSKAYANYAHGGDKHGWALLVPLGGYAKVGKHQILVQAVDDQGATRDIGIADVELTR